MVMVWMAMAAGSSLTVVATAAAATPIDTGLLLIPPTDPNFQYIGRMEDGDGGVKMFDMPGCEIRARIDLAEGVSPDSVARVCVQNTSRLNYSLFQRLALHLHLPCH
jgi:hypothetical protein